MYVYKVTNSMLEYLAHLAQNYALCSHTGKAKIRESITLLAKFHINFFK